MAASASLETPLKEKLRRIICSMSSAKSSGRVLPQNLLLQAAALLKAYPIEVTELRASPQQLAFQGAFFKRADAIGRRCAIFVAHGANRCLGPETLVGGPGVADRPGARIKGEHQVW